MKYFFIRKMCNQFTANIELAAEKTSEELIGWSEEEGDFDNEETLLCTTNKEEAENKFSTLNSICKSYENYAMFDGRTLLTFELIEFTEEEIDINEWSEAEIEKQQFFGDVIHSKIAPLLYHPITRK